MEKRKVLFGSYDTALTWPWTLVSCELSPAEYKSNFVSVPGRNGDLDMSTALTDGDPRYGNRTLTVVLECSEGTRLERETAINTMTNWLDGWRMDIILPDDPDHYLTGRVHVQRNYNDMAHAAVTVTATCDPWRYNNRETALQFVAGAEVATAMLSNSGRRTVVPLLTISGTDAMINLTAGTAAWALGAGTYQLPDLSVSQGGQIITYSGVGNLAFTYREAVL